MSVLRSWLVAALLPLAWPLPAAAQAYPAKPVKIVVPFPAGGTADLLARGLGDVLSGYWSQPVVVENKPGAGSLVATQFVQRAPADGYTLLINAPSFLVNPVLNADARYDALKDFEPVSLLVTSPLVLVVNASAGAGSVKDLASLSRTRPGQLSFATVGPGTTQQMIGEMLKLEAGIDWVYAPFAGGAPAVTALLGNHVSAVIANYSEVSQQVGAGKLRALAVGSRERLESMKDVPTLVELGHTSIDGTIWFGIVAPAGTPRPVVDRLQADIAKALQVPALKEKLLAQYLYPVEGPPDAFGAFLSEQARKYARFIKQAGIKAN